MLKRFLPIFLAVFFLSIHYAAILYVNSSYLGQFFELSEISMLFVLGALANVLVFSFTPRIVHLLGTRKLFLMMLVLETLAVWGLIGAKSALVAGTFFIIFSFAVPVIYYIIDLLLEELTENDRTGEIRGIFLTALNLAIALSPLLIASLLADGSYSPIYVASLVLLLPLFVLSFWFKKRADKKPRHPHPLNLPWLLWWQTLDVRRVTFARFVLEFFFAVMVVYSPLYLHTTLGFSWQVIGVIFTIMLIPFVVFQWPVGELADRLYGEKEFMATGFGFMALTLFLMPFLPAGVLIWTVVLFLSRVGASFVEVTTESYFFKQVGSDDTGTLGIFRLARPFGIVLGAGMGVLVLKFLAIPTMFVLTGLVALWGMRQALLIEDSL